MSSKTIINLCRFETYQSIANAGKLTPEIRKTICEAISRVPGVSRAEAWTDHDEETEVHHLDVGYIDWFVTNESAPFISAWLRINLGKWGYGFAQEDRRTACDKPGGASWG